MPSAAACNPIAIAIDELAIEFRNLWRQIGQNVHATVYGADEPFPYLEAFRNFKDAGFWGFTRKPASIGYFVDVGS